LKRLPKHSLLRPKSKILNPTTSPRHSLNGESNFAWHRLKFSGDAGSNYYLRTTAEKRKIRKIRSEFDKLRAFPHNPDIETIRKIPGSSTIDLFSRRLREGKGGQFR
jgi:hypothetical protein